MKIHWIEKQGSKAYWIKRGRIGRYEVEATRHRVLLAHRNGTEVRVLYSLKLAGKLIWGPGSFAEFRAIVRRLNCEEIHIIAS